MKIAIDLTALAFNFSGIERYALNISKNMIQNDSQDEFWLLFCNKIHPDFEELIRQENVKCQIVKSGSSKFSKLWMFQIKNLLALNHMKADRYVFLAFEPPILMRNPNMIITIHDIGFFDCPQMWKWYVSLYGQIKMKAAIRHCHRIVTVSNFTKRRLEERFSIDEEKISVVYNAMDNKFRNDIADKDKSLEVRKKYKLPMDNFILCLSTLEPRKNLRLLIEAYTDLKKENKIDHHLVLAGRKGWKIDSLFKNIDSEIKQYIHFTGFIDDDELPYVYKAADLFVFPSKYEGFGIPPLEAMACGTQPVVSDLDVFKEVFGEAAIYFANNNVDDLKNAILSKNVVDSRILKEQSSRYSWEKSGRQYLEAMKL